MMRIIKSFFANLATLALAFTLAIVIWGVAERDADPEDQLSLQLPVNVVNMPAEAQVNGVPDTVEIIVEGPESILEQLAPADFEAELDVSQVAGGEASVPIEVTHNEENVEIVLQFPERADITMERIVQREIPVRVETRGDAARGYATGDILVDPPFIAVRGLASRVEALSEARVTVFLDSPRQDVIITRRPIYYDRQGTSASINNLSVSADEVTISIPVSQLAGYAAKPIIVDWEGEPAQGYRLLDVRVEPDSVLVTGSPAQLEALTRVRTEPIDITGLKESLTIPVTLDLPSGIEVDEVQPIIVEIEIEPILTTSVIRKTPEIRALGEGLTMTLDVDEVRVFLFGPLDKLDSLLDDDVRVTLDLFDLDIGTYSLEPNADVSVADIEVRSIQPARLTVSITRALTTTEDITGTEAVTSTISLLPCCAGASPLPPVVSGYLHGAAPVALRPFLALREIPL